MRWYNAELVDITSHEAGLRSVGVATDLLNRAVRSLENHADIQVAVFAPKELQVLNDELIYEFGT